MGCGGCKEEKGLVQTVVHGAAGLVKAAVGIDRPEYNSVKRRRLICRACEHAVRCDYDLKLFCRCSICHCNLKAKTAVASESCPINKWLSVKQEAVT